MQLFSAQIDSASDLLTDHPVNFQAKLSYTTQNRSRPTCAAVLLGRWLGPATVVNLVIVKPARVVDLVIVNWRIRQHLSEV